MYENTNYYYYLWQKLALRLLLKTNYIYVNKKYETKNMNMKLQFIGIPNTCYLLFSISRRYQIKILYARNIVNFIINDIFYYIGFLT